MNKNSIEIDRKSLPFLLPIILVLGIGIGLAVAQIFNSAKVNTNNGSVASVESSQYVNDIYDLIKQKFIGEVPQGSELDYAKIKGIINSLDSKYTSFLTPAEAAQYKKSEDPNFEGVGVSLQFNGQDTQIETVLANYPAEKAGLRAKDVISKVDGVEMRGKYPSEVATKIRGQAGTSVKIEVIREGSSDSLVYDITRVSIDIDNISYKKLDGGIYKIDIYQFVDSTPEALNASWDKVVNEIVANNDARGIIIDLRNNPGGYVFSVRHILEEFFKNGTVLMKERQKDTNEAVYKDYRVGKFEDIPLAVIVNEGSASASEIFAAAIQDNNRGKIVGAKTVGKGVEQQAIDLTDGSMLIIVFQEWLTPSGRNITPENSIKPDFEIGYTQDDFKSLSDPQLEKAVELLK